MKFIKNMFKHYFRCMTVKYFNFSGRATLAEFWSVILVNMLFQHGVLYVVAGIVGFTSHQEYLYSATYIVLTLIPMLGLLVRRLHDIGLSMLWTVAFLIPIIGSMFIIVLAIFPGKSEPNRYGHREGYQAQPGMQEQVIYS